MNKKGEKSLQMIFGLFLLLIISLVVLSMFFKFVKKGSTETQTAADDYIKSAAIEAAKTDCENLCKEANDDNSKIEFCSSIYEVDWDKDGTVEGKAQYGAWWFCESKVPCFVLVPQCKNKFDGHYCRDLLAELAPNKYYRLYVDAEGDVPAVGDYGDGCSLPTSTSDDPDNNIFPTQYNWKERFCFDKPYDFILDPDPADWTCPGEAWS